MVLTVHFEVLEDIPVGLLELENALIVGFEALSVVVVDGWPLLEIKLVNKHVRIQQSCHLDTHFHQLNKVVLEQIRVHIRVLILDDVVDHDCDGSDLVVLDGRVDGRDLVAVAAAAFVVLDVDF